MKKNWLFFLFLIVTLNGVKCADEHCKDISSFEKALDDLYKRKPHLFILKHEDHLPKKKEESWPDYKTCTQAIDILALASAFVRIYIAHARIDLEEDDDWFDRTITLICPDLIIRIAKQSKFLKESIEITLETILLKTVAQLILYCGKGDGFDLLKKALRYTKKIFVSSSTKEPYV